MNEWISKQKQSKFSFAYPDWLSDVLRMSTSALWPYMVKGLGRGTYGLGLGLEGPGLGLEGWGLGLGLEILALTTSLDMLFTKAQEMWSIVCLLLVSSNSCHILLLHTIVSIVAVKAGGVYAIKSVFVDVFVYMCYHWNLWTDWWDFPVLKAVIQILTCPDHVWDTLNTVTLVLE